MTSVLVVDDEPRIVSFISRALTSEGFRVDGAHDGVRGFDLARTGRYELVVLDLLLPGIDGVTVLQRLMDERPQQRVLVLSALSDIGSTLRRRWLEIAWGVFSIANLVVIVSLRRWETIPFHLIWVSLTLLYGFRVWRPRTTAIVLLVVILSTGITLTWTVLLGNEQLDEVAEVPLMAAMFVAMAMHAHRRQRAVEAERRSSATVRRVLERQREFVRDASHELRTPITIARGHAELLRGNALDERPAKDADVVLEELDRLSQLSERLLTLASADHPGFLTFRDVVVEDLVAETLVRWGPVAPRAWRIDVQVEGPVRADRDRLAAAIDALIENAVHATETGDRIEVTARAEGSILVLEVSD